MFLENKQLLKEARKRVDAFVSEYAHAQRKFKEESKDLKAALTACADAEEAQKITQLVAQTVQQQAHAKISSVVSRCLSAVFDEPYQFKIIFEQKRGRTEARLVFMDGESELDPMTASGGGVVDVAAFALRLSALLLSQPPLRRVLIMDEPFKFLSADYHDRARILMEQLSQELKVQFIYVTHISALETGKVVRL